MFFTPPMSVLETGILEVKTPELIFHGRLVKLGEAPVRCQAKA